MNFMRMMATLDLILSKVGKGNYKVQGNGKYQVRCPVHDDHKESLSVTLTSDGSRVLLYCHAGCKTEDILKSLGLSWGDINQNDSNLKNKNPIKGLTIIDTYDYVDENGNLIFQTVKFLDKSKEKCYKQRRPDNNGSWIWNLTGVKRVLYRLPEVIQAIRDGVQIFIVEGEKDADTLARNGFIATTNPLGARKWKESYSETLRGGHVIVIPDNDDSGREHAESVAQQLIGKANTVKYLELPNLDIKGDVTDWFRNGGTIAQFESLVEKAQNYKVADHQSLQAENLRTDGISLTEEFWYEGGEGIKISHYRLIDFLECKGFYKYYLNDLIYFFVRVIDNVVHIRSIAQIKDFVLDYIRDLNHPNQSRILEALIRGASNYFSKPLLECLPTKVLNFKNSTKKNQFFYYKNCFIEITADNVTIHKYSELKWCVWATQIIDREFEIFDPSGSEYERFLKNISNFYDTPDRYTSIITGTGYLLHSYKHKAIAKVIIFVDEQIPSDDNEANGGTEKGICCQGIKKMKKWTVEDGEAIDPRKQFILQQVDVDTEVLHIDDVPRKFNFQALFSRVTDDWKVEKKYQDPVILNYESTPKIVITTNFTIRGKGSSYKRRMFEIELRPYYNEHFTPADEFGHQLFDDWDSIEWLKFDNFMIKCCQLYLKKGLVHYKLVNLKKRKLLDETAIEFFDFAESKILPGEEYDKKLLYDQFLEEYPDFNRIKQRTLTSWFRLYAEYKGWEVDEFQRFKSRKIRFSKDSEIPEWVKEDI